MSLQAEIAKEAIASASSTSGRRRDIGGYLRVIWAAAETASFPSVGTCGRHSMLAAWSVNSQFMTPFHAFVS
jgi:hypothetical protein